MKYFERPNGNLQGDDKPIPNRGTGTGLSDSYGFDTSINATNRQGNITGATKSHSPDEMPGCNNKAGC